ncbi:hypothetical protein LTR95_004838 [Oleoguttula sp. CCFEE 5521]
MEPREPGKPPQAVMTPERPSKRAEPNFNKTDPEYHALEERIGRIEVKKTIPYDVCVEDTGFLQCPELGQLQAFVRRIDKLIIGHLEEHKDVSSTKGLLARSLRCMAPSAHPLLLSVNGPVGAGKSSVINCMYSAGDIAHSNAVGKSVTLAPHYFMPRQAQQESACLVEVFFLGTDKAEPLFRGLLRLFVQAEHATMDTAGVNDMDTSEHIDQRDNITSILTSLFKNHAGYGDIEATRESLSAVTALHDTATTKQFGKWAGQRKQSEMSRMLSGAQCVTIDMPDIDDLLPKLAVYTRDEVSNELALWPLVSHVNIYLDSTLGRMGITVLDAPGGGDISVRTENARVHTARATHALVVSGLARAEQDGVMRQVRTVKDLGDGNVMLALTQIDVIDDQIKIEMSLEARRELEMLASIKADYKAQHDSAEDEYQQPEDADSQNHSEVDNELKKLLKEKTQLNRKLRKATTAETLFRIEARSEHVAKGLARKLKDNTGLNTPVETVTLSNSLYLRHLQGYRHSDVPDLNVEQTKIPRVLRIISDMMYIPAVLQEWNTLERVEIPNLIQDVRYNAHDSTTEGLNAVRVLLVIPIEECKVEIVKFEEDLLRELQDNLISGPRDKRSSWNEAAWSTCKGWGESIKSGPFLRLMQRDGVRRDYIDLSTELLCLNTKDVEALFRGVTNFSEKVKTLVKALQRMLDHVIKKVRDKAALQNANALDLTRLLAVMTTQRQSFSTLTRAAGTVFTTEMRGVKEKATQGGFVYPQGYENNNINVPLDYRAGNRAAGHPNWGRYRIDQLYSKIKETCWEDAGDSLDAGVTKVAGKASQSLIIGAQTVFQDILNTFDENVNRKQASSKEKMLQNTLMENFATVSEDHASMGPLIEKLAKEYGGQRGLGHAEMNKEDAEPIAHPTPKFKSEKMDSISGPTEGSRVRTTAVHAARITRLHSFEGVVDHLVLANAPRA